MLEQFIPIGRLLLFILVVQPSLNIEAILQEVGQFVAEGAEKFPGFHDPGSAQVLSQRSRTATINRPSPHFISY